MDKCKKQTDIDITASGDCGKCNELDLIRRQDAIDALQKEINKGIPPFDDVIGSIRCGVRLARNIIEDLPSAEPEPPEDICGECDAWNKYKSERKNGKCIWCDSPYRIEYYWIDRDGNTASFQDEEKHVVATGIANYCPNCGADMRGEQDDK